MRLQIFDARAFESEGIQKASARPEKQRVTHICPQGADCGSAFFIYMRTIRIVLRHRSDRPIAIIEAVRKPRCRIMRSLPILDAAFLAENFLTKEGLAIGSPAFIEPHVL